MRKTKIICTLGPAAADESTISKLVQAGMNAARFNFSHGTHESHAKQLETLRRVCTELGRPVATVLDTKGPEVRIKSFKDKKIRLQAGDSFTLTTADVQGDNRIVSVTYPELHEVLRPGARVLIDDGLIELAVRSVEGREIECVVKNGGELSENKSVNLPDVPLPLPALTEQDMKDLRFAVQNDFDFVAASFVRRAGDVSVIRETLDSFGGQEVRIISKIENREGVDNIDEIIAASAGIMVARGDLGVEIPAFEVPIIQKRLIKKATERGKLVIIATQMLDSMIRNPRPTRAEVSDVANAVFDEASCVMLSGETASGKYPVEALKMMVDIIEATESEKDYWAGFLAKTIKRRGSVSDAISHTCCLAAMDLDAAAVLTPTKTGYTANMISRFRPGCPVIALASSENVLRQLGLEWGVYPIRLDTADSTDELFELSVSLSLKAGMLKRGDIVVITAGVPIGKVGSTNLIKVHNVDYSSGA